MPRNWSEVTVDTGIEILRNLRRKKEKYAEAVVPLIADLLIELKICKGKDR